MVHSKRRRRNTKLKPWCYWCNREFDSERTLIKHQRLRHFRCPFCRHRAPSILDLTEHTRMRHGRELLHVPHAMRSRSSPLVQVFGLDGIPAGTTHPKDDGKQQYRPPIAPFRVPAIPLLKAALPKSMQSESKALVFAPDPTLSLEEKRIRTFKYREYHHFIK